MKHICILLTDRKHISSTIARTKKYFCWYTRILFDQLYGYICHLLKKGPGWLNELGTMWLDYLSPIRRRSASGLVNYKKGCTRPAVASYKVYQLLPHGRWFSPGTSASSITKTGRHDIAKILLKVALNTINQSIHHLLKLHTS